MKREIEYSIKSSTRIDLAGGLLDIWPVHALVPDCFVVNCSIPVFTSVELKFHSHSDRHFHESGNPAYSEIDIKILSPSSMYEKSFFGLQNLLEEPAEELNLLKKHLEYWERIFRKKSFSKGVKREDDEMFIPDVNNLSALSLKSESPMGGGLGASSSLCVSLAKVFCSVFKKELTQSELLLFCRDLEASVLHAPAGIQDYIPAMESDPDSLYIIECAHFGPHWRKRKIPVDFFKDHLLLVDTGKSHHSGNNNWEILKKIIEKDQRTLNGIYQLRDNALKTMEVCEQENWSELSVCLNWEQELRGKYFSNWLNSSVSSIIDLMKEGGVEAVKLCGSGGGGCLIILAKNGSEKKKLELVCKKNNIPIVMNW